MRIAIFHEVQKGGARRSINEFAIRLKKTHTVDLYTTERLTHDEKKNYSKVYISNFVETHWEGSNIKKKLSKDILDLWKLNKIHRSIAERINIGLYDFVFVNPSRYIQSPFILRHIRKPTFFYLHDPHYRLVYENIFFNHPNDVFRSWYEQIIREVRKYIDKRNIRNADFLIANSAYTQHTAKKTYGINSHLSYLGVDSSFFSPKKHRRDIDVLYIGSTKHGDNYLLAKKSLARIKRPLSVRYVLTDKEWFDDKSIRDLYQRSKITLSLTENEPFGLVPLEAMACGSIPVVLNSAGYKDSVQAKKSGYLIPHNPKTVADTIDHILLEYTKHLKMREYIRSYVIKEWTWEKRTKELEQLITTLVHK